MTTTTSERKRTSSSSVGTLEAFWVVCPFLSGWTAGCRGFTILSGNLLGRFVWLTLYWSPYRSFETSLSSSIITARRAGGRCVGIMKCWVSNNLKLDVDFGLRLASGLV